MYPTQVAGSFPPPESSNSLPPTPMAGGRPREDSPSDGRLQSVQAAYDHQKRKIHNMAFENDTLKRELSFARKQMAESVAIRQQRDKYERSLKDVQKNIDSALDRVRISRNNEQVAQNKVYALQARLDDANMQKVDVLENQQGLRDKLRQMEKEMAALQEEVTTLRKRPEQSLLEEAQGNIRKAEVTNKHLAEQVHAVDGRTDLPAVVADLSFKLEDMERKMKLKDSHIAELLQQGQDTAPDMQELEQHRAIVQSLKETHERLSRDRENSITKMLDMERQVQEYERASRNAQAERDQFRQLLYAEFRRAAIEVHNRQNPATSLLDQKVNLDAAINEVRAKAQHYIAHQTAQQGKEDKSDPHQRVKELEQEVEYHVKDIVLYKLDVKGYKKDLKRAQAKIQQLSGGNSESSSPQKTFRTSIVSLEARPSISSRSSSSTVPQLTTSSTLDDCVPTTPRTEHARGGRLSVMTYTPSGTPGGSPAVSPRKEKKSFFG
jgi:chromosome segregation ATPase